MRSLYRGRGCHRPTCSHCTLGTFVAWRRAWRKIGRSLTND